MSFDKTKAMRSAERYLSQGKIRAAIGEYKTIVENDPKDFNTLNMLGDLYVKNKDKAEAVGCFTRVAEYYGKQGFSQKAIAIYNKISRLQPESMDVSARLAELYQAKGSVAEARTHYVALADQYQRGGKKMEALSIWKQIAELDPNNAEVYLKIAESYWQEKQKDEAAEAFTIAGTRLTAQGKHEAALTAFSRALEIRQHDFNALNGFVKSQINLGYADEAAKTLENILEQQPYNRDILYLLADCHLETDNPQAAERAVVKLVEQEPANYPKFLELVEAYLKGGDLDSAARILSVSSEHLLVGGQSSDFLKWTNEILNRNPEHLAALRLLVRFYGWNRDENELRDSLERLAESARLADSTDDEKSALSQLTMLVPHDTNYAQRLQELNYGYSGQTTGMNHEDNTGGSAENANPPADSPYQGFDIVGFATTGGDSYESFAADSDDYSDTYDFAVENPEVLYEKGDSEFGELNSSTFDDYGAISEPAENIVRKAETGGKLSAGDEMRLEKETESIRFYIEQGYYELAEKTIQDLEAEFGSHREISELRGQLRALTGGAQSSPLAEALPEPQSHSWADVNSEVYAQPEMTEPFQTAAGEQAMPDGATENPAAGPANVGDSQKHDFFSDFRNDLDLEETEAPAGSDYETHFQMAIAYSEMGLSEEAIREFQDAINQVKPDDGTRRFFQCAHMIGNCFMEKQMPHLALLWYQRALEISDLSVEEKQGIWYEVALAYEAGGDSEKALENFEKIYAIDVDYRDVKQRVQNLLVGN